MIGDDADAGRRLLEKFRAAAGIAPTAPGDPFEATVSDPRFPGALLSLPVNENGEAVVYAAASTGADWRRLRPLLMAFAGPTLTDFSGAPSVLHAAVPHEQVLTGAGLAAVARLRSSPQTAISAGRALKRMVAMVGRAPARAAPAPESTGRLLARIRDHLNALAIDDARRLLERCRAEHRLDALNLKFLEIEILTTARDWRGIVGLDGFEDVLRTRRPPAITAALLEALYWTGPGDVPQDAGRYAGSLRTRVRDLIRLPAPSGMADGAWRLFALEALADKPPNAELATAVLQSDADVGDLRNRLCEALTKATPAPPEPLSPAAAVTAADLSGSLSAFEQAQVLLAALTEAERNALLEAAQPRAALAAMEATFGPEPPPSGWLGWMARIEDPAFTTALAVARQGALEWAADIADPVQVDALATALLTASDTAPAGERLLEALPHLVAWLLRDPEFPRTSGRPLYEAALDRLLLSGRTSTPLLDSAAVLARALLALGLRAEAYRRLLMDIVEASGEAAGLRTAYWLIDLVEETLAASSPDQAAREAFWQSALARLAPIARQLSPLQRLSLRRLAAGAGWADTFDEPAEAAEPSPTDTALPSRLAGKMVAIYTLTASAGAQAAEALKVIAPDVDVRVNSEHDGSPRLQALAENADLFVVVAASATHAATDAIRANRGERPLVYAAGRGAVSILRAVEDWARAQGSTVAALVHRP